MIFYDPLRRLFLRQEAKINALSRAGVITANKFGEKNKKMRNFRDNQFVNFENVRVCIKLKIFHENRMISAKNTLGAEIFASINFRESVNIKFFAS